MTRSLSESRTMLSWRGAVDGRAGTALRPGRSPLASARPTSRRTAPCDSCSTAAPVTRNRIISGGSISALVSSKCMTYQEAGA
jgi:hypothetical protein